MRLTLNVQLRALQQISTALILTCVAGSSFALVTDRDQPISLEADRATFNENTGVTQYSGNVRIEQGTMKLEADNIVAQLNAKRELQSVNATGKPAKFQQLISQQRGLARGEAQKISYNAETGILSLTGNAYLYQNGSSLRGNSLRYSMNKGDIEATGSAGNRVQFVIPPSSSRSFPGVRDK